MEKRLLLAVLLMSATILLTNLIFPPPEPPPGEADDPAAEVERAPAAAPQRPALSAPAPRAGAPADTVVVRSPLYRYALSTRGAALVSAELLEYASYTRDGPVQLVPRGESDFLTHRLVVGSDTIDLSQATFTPSTSDIALEEGDTSSLTLTYQQPGGFGLTLVYTFSADRYLVDVSGRVTGVGAPAVLLTEIAPGLAQNEAADHHNEQQLAIVTRSGERVERLRLNKVQGSGAISGELSWAGIKDKYFLAVLVPGQERPFQGALIEDVPDRSEARPGAEEEVVVPQARLVTALPIPVSGEFAFRTYLGPQEFDRLRGVGYDLENVTQYAYRWLEPIIRPVAAAILWVLERLHSTLGIAYGWVLVLFGVLMRVVLWPLNAKAMRAQMKNMAVQPMMQELREKYKDDPTRQQQEIMKLVKEHGFNPFAGCLPLLIPFPVLITLFFVFQNTIAFRGADFLWLPDLSLRDPLYLLPLFLVISMFGLQWISAKASGMEQNPQMKMMMYFMPIMMGVLFFTLPAGLNLYYATTNVASIPQQLLIARERRRAKEEMEREQAAAAPAARSGRGRGRPKGGKRRASGR